MTELLMSATESACKKKFKKKMFKKKMLKKKLRNKF